LLPVQKPGTNDYCPVQDLWEVNQAAVSLHLVAPNLYTLLALIPAEATCFSCLDLKDAFFCIQLAPVSQSIFAFHWEDPQSWGQQQLTWTHLPQGFKNFLTIFGTALASDLQAYPAEEAGCTLLQYVDDLLLAGANHQDCLKGAQFLLCLLWEAGYKVSQKKAQICQDQVKYLGFTSPRANKPWHRKKRNCLFKSNPNFKNIDL
jgi:hypothetical protein